MPDILIRMEMPPSCTKCPFEAFGDCYGGKVKRIMDIEDYIERGERHPDCPLHELQPHGDLIDVSKIVLEYGGLAKISPHDFVGIAKYFAKQIEGQPVIVPEERSEG